MLRVRNTPLLAILLLLASLVVARHIHYPRHKHARQVVSTIASPSPLLSAAEDAVINDMAEIEQGLADIPEDVLDFLVSADEELEQEEAELSGIVSSSTETEAAVLPSSVETQAPAPAAQAAATTLTTLPSLPTPSAYMASSDNDEGSTFVMTRTLRRTSTIYRTTILYPTSISPISSLSALEPNPTSLAQTTTSNSSLLGYLTSEPVATPTVVQSPPPSNTNTTAVFNATSSSNVAVYYGQSPNTTVEDLDTLCQDPNVNIVILAFVTSFFSPSGMPSASFGPGCTTTTPAQQLSAPGLTDCSALAPAITTCQRSGKIVLVSLGGYGNNVSIPTASAAAQLATNLFSLFGAGTSLDSSLRPFGPDIILDGFDLDNETGDPSNWYALAAALRSQFLLASTSTNRTFYLSAAPQCPIPDANIPLQAMALADFVYVQFYDNPACDLDSDGFQDSFAQWSADLKEVSNFTRLFVGVAAFEANGGQGYVEGSGLETRISLARELGTDNFGGVMLWDGSGALDNVDLDGDDYLVYAKASLE